MGRLICTFMDIHEEHYELHKNVHGTLYPSWHPDEYYWLGDDNEEEIPVGDRMELGLVPLQD